MPARRARLTFSGLFALILLGCVPQSARADDLFADLDRDGVRDVVSIPQAPARGLLVWLSSSKLLLRLPTRRPITRVTVGDIDGDGRLDLVAADSSSKLHVWHRTPHGKLRTTHPRQHPLSTGPAHPRALDASSVPETPAIGSDAPSDVACDEVHPAAPALDAGRLIADVARGSSGPRSGTRHDPRGPPSF